MDAQRPPHINAPPSAFDVRPRVLITAGPTQEPIDRVRYISNRSSGRMGISLANACADRGWPATLLLGPISSVGTDLPIHTAIRVERFRTANDLQQLLNQHWPAHDVLLMAAAVADFTVREVSPSKIKRTGDRVTLELSATPDLLKSLAPTTRANQITIGFALEPADDLAREAARKLKAKRIDAIVANPLETMDASDVTATLLLADGRSVTPPPRMAKDRFANWLLDQIPLVSKVHENRERIFSDAARNDGSGDV